MAAERPPRRRHVKSTVDRLDPAIREEIIRLRLVEGRTLDEILGALKSLGGDVSRSALGRHVQQLESEVEERKQVELAKISPALQFANALAGALVAGFEEMAGPDKLDATAEVLQAHLFRMATAGMKEGEEGLSPKDVFVMSRGLQTLEQAKRTKEKRLAEEARRAAEQAKKEAAARVEDVVRREKGLSAETVAAIRHAVLGDA